MVADFFKVVLSSVFVFLMDESCFSSLNSSPIQSFEDFFLFTNAYLFAFNKSLPTLTFR